MPKQTLILMLLMFLAACVSPAEIGPAAPTRARSTPTPEPLPPTAAPTQTPVPTASLTPQEALFPYTIEGLRQHNYQGGEVTVIGVIEETKDFTSYLIEYPSDGLKIRGVMQIPTRAAPPYPVIVLNHGFFMRSAFISGDGTGRAAEYLNTRGYLTLAPDYRTWGTSDFGPSLFYAGLAMDVINLLKAIPSIPEADPVRVGLWGHSMGGAVTMKVLAVIGNNPQWRGAGESPPVIVRAAVLYSTVSVDQAQVLARWGPGCLGDVSAGESRPDCNSSDVLPLDLPSELLDAYLKAVGDPNLLRLVSPINYLGYVDAPIQIHYGDLDGLELSGTPPEWSEDLARALLEADKSVRLIIYEGQRHSFVNEAWYSFMDSVAKFFNQYVKNPQ